MAKKAKSNIFSYKGMPIARKGNVIYYGNAEDKYFVRLNIESTERIDDIDVSTKISVYLIKNNEGNTEVVKKASREGLFSAFDIASVWLTDALEEQA